MTKLTPDDVRFFLRCTDESDVRFLALAEVVNIAIRKWLGWTKMLIRHDANERSVVWQSPDGGYTDDTSRLPGFVLGLEALGNLHKAAMKMELRVDNRLKELRVMWLYCLLCEPQKTPDDFGHSFSLSPWMVRCLLNAGAPALAIALLKTVNPERFE